MIIIKHAGIHDIAVIHELAHRIWPTVYGNIISPQQIKYMLLGMYAQEVLQHKMTVQHHDFIIAYEDEMPVGFACFYERKNLPVRVCRLDKLYVLPDQQGKGIGNQLIQHIISKIKPAGITVLDLTVNRKNIAVEFYKKLGFQIVAEEDTDIGSGFFMNDYIMQQKI
ncbi:MAG: GNAT family N-acetyltransferase [Chitinophagaceae bacterium]|nr:GNAT family N-acetyltransferase [Chitinophagaceae bacterium]